MPQFFLILTIVAFYPGGGIWVIMVVMGLTGWTGIARYTRGEFLKTRNRNYVYITEKYKIKCERKFEVNPKNIVVGFSSKNCF